MAVSRPTAHGDGALRAVLEMLAERQAQRRRTSDALLPGGTWHGPILEMQIEHRVERYEVTAFGDGRPSYISGPARTRVFVRAIYDPEHRLPLPGETVTFELEVQGRRVAVPCFVTDMRVISRPDSLTEVELSGQVVGEIDYATATGAAGPRAPEPERPARAVRITAGDA